MKFGYGYPTTGHNKTALLLWENVKIFPRVRSSTNFGAILLVGSEKGATKLGFFEIYNGVNST